MPRLTPVHPFIPSDAAWPYADGFFDVIISNQVGEHLHDHGRFVGEIARCLDEKGFSVNLFPLKHVIMEWHVLVPFAHRVKNYDALKASILAYRRMSAAVLRKPSDPLLYENAVSGAEYVVKYTGYVGYGERLSIAKRHGLLVSMRYTKEFYVQKLRQLLSRPPRHDYPRQRSVVGDWLLVFLLRYLQGVTVLLEKGDRAPSRPR